MSYNQKCFYVMGALIILGIGFVVTGYLSSSALKKSEENYILKRQLHFSKRFPNCVRQEGCGFCIALYYSWPKNDSDFDVWNQGIKDAGCEGVPAGGSFNINDYKK